jgi:hypothetical protein
MICGANSVDAHHLLRADGVKGMGMKTGDDMTVNLCRNHHNQIHNMNEKRFFSLYGLTYEKVLEHAQGLYQKTLERRACKKSL